MTMNEMDGETKRGYNKYANEVQQLEWEQAERVRRTRLEWVEQSLRAALADYDHMMSSDHTQVQHTVPEHTGANASQVAADANVTDGKRGVKPLGRPFSYPSGVVADGWAEYLTTCLCWRCDAEAEYAGFCEAHYDQWLEEQADDQQPDLMWEEEWDDLMSAEELERAQREQEERHND